MALAPKFKAHRLVFSDAAGATVADADPLHTVELYLDYVCPFSAKMFNTLYHAVFPALRNPHPDQHAPARRVQFLFRHQVQPWHPSSTLVHEAGLAVQRAAAAAGRPQLFWDFSAALFRDQRAYMDAHVVDETRNATYKRLAALAAAATDGAVDADKVYSELAVQPAPAPAPDNYTGPVNTGNAITDDLKVVIKMGRLVGVHVSPTVLVDGVVNNEIASSWTADQWLAWLGKSVA
ncbi:Thioredoxin-like fold protein [Niveomyces insectorum RCEF 264]|uniref:Thioredoxin-like fold protein n=1 Tax=Niveomyces insectorum RCEF 264 TaxID=1081102 RepID=A0A167UYG1_9HYPO|nr:Thioredoxin-like fold protein [Niveomyces insectorum RCEF 264]